jgi:hypothetical protein
MMRVEDDLLEPSSFAFRDVHVPLMAHLKRYTIKKKNTFILGPTNRYSNKKRGMWPSCVERYTPKPVSK